MQNSELVDKLIALAGSDLDLVRQAIRACSAGGRTADLEKIVNFIVEQRKRSCSVEPEEVP